MKKKCIHNYIKANKMYCKTHEFVLIILGLCKQMQNVVGKVVKKVHEQSQKICEI